MKRTKNMRGKKVDKPRSINKKTMKSGSIEKNKQDNKFVGTWDTDLKKGKKT